MEGEEEDSGEEAEIDRLLHELGLDLPDIDRSTTAFRQLWMNGSGIDDF